MATSRLPFLYPNLLRSVRSCEPTTYRSIRSPPQPRGGRAGLHTTQPYEQVTTIHQRYGSAADPSSYPPPWPKDKLGPPPSVGAPKDGPKREPVVQEKEESSFQLDDSASSSKQDTSSSDTVASSASESPTNIAAELPRQNDVNESPSSESASPATGPDAAAQKHNADASADSISCLFEVPDEDGQPSQSDSSSSDSSSPGSQLQKSPPLTPPPYVHHFDTYGLVKDLTKGGFTEQQAIQIMKAIRGLLADNLAVAKKELYSKSDFENERYLFSAACSELRNFIQTSRNAGIQAQRSRRAQLQQEADILSQRLNQELMGLNDNIKEMFNDQKIWTRELQRSLDTNIQELNYKITVSLHSDGRSEVESLRWILTRRAAIAIATSAFMIILALRYYSYKHHEMELEKKRAVEAAAAATATSQPTQDDSLHGS
ncbi:hypothetical protein VTO42DRAFT_207 [Malbranchea cinnamomea]